MSPYRVDARLSGRHPFEIYLLYLTLLTSLPTLLGITPRPGSIEHAMPGWLQLAWSVTLTLGAANALGGIYLPRRDIGLIMEQLGLALVGTAAVIYFIVAIVDNGVDALQPLAIVGGFGAACLKRAWDIQSQVDRVHAEQLARERRDRQ